MEERLDYSKRAPNGIGILRQLAGYLKKTGLEPDLVDLTLAVIAIHSWNRLAISFRAPAGSYQPDFTCC